MTDAFGEPILTKTATTVPISRAQQVARQCRNDACRALLGLPSTSPCLPPVLGLEGSSRLLMDSVTTAVLANDPLPDLITIRSLIKKVRQLTAAAIGVPESYREALAIAAFYDTMIGGRTMESGVSALKSLPLALWGRSLIYVAEKYYFDSKEHYSKVLEWGMERISLALKSPDFQDERNRNQLVKALEALGRANLLRARQGIYCQDPAINSEYYLTQSIGILQRAVRQCNLMAEGVLCNRTVYYDLARACLLHGEIDQAKPLLERANKCNSLPLPAVFTIEPDFTFVRDSDWFRALEINHKQSSPPPSSPEMRQYNAMKQALYDNGIGNTRVADDALRFSLYMCKPQGPLPKNTFEDPIKERNRELVFSSGQKRLKERMELFGLREKVIVPGDGNCQFAAISDQLYNDFDHAPMLRRMAVEWLSRNRDWDVGNNEPICRFVYMDFDEYLAEMSRPGIWGDHLTLVAISEMLHVKISIISSVENDSSFFTEIKPRIVDNEDQVLLLSHFAEYHYGSLTLA